MELPEYEGPIVNRAVDTNRWDLLDPRAGDIIVAVSDKMGTTWTQMLCALLVHLAGFLGIDRAPDEIRALCEAARFDAMRADADNLAPGAKVTGRWKSNADFFRKGRLAEWREVLSRETQDLYVATTRSRYDHAMLDWLERGRSATGDPRDL